MSDFTADSITQPSSNIFVRALTAFWDGLVRIGETSYRARMLNALAQYSDADLERMGLTRAELVSRTFTDGYHL